MAVKSAGMNAGKKLTFEYATRALKLIFDRIVVPRRRFGDVYVKLLYNDVHFGDVRVLKIDAAARAAAGVDGNSGVVADARR